MSLVLAADYRVPDFDHWWAGLAGDLPRLPGLGPHHVVVYRSLADASRVFVTIGVAGRGPVDILLRSPVMLSWFDSAGVDEIPPMFAGEVVEKLDLDPRAGPSATPGAVIVAAIAPVGRLEGPKGARAGPPGRQRARRRHPPGRLRRAPLLDLPRPGRPGRGDDPAGDGHRTPGGAVDPPPRRRGGVHRGGGSGRLPAAVRRPPG